MTLRFDFIHRDEETLLCEGRITLVTIDASGAKAPVPDPLRALVLSGGR